MKTLLLGCTLLCISNAQAQSILPLPTGQFSVGRRTLFMVDTTRYEPATSDQQDRRRITLHIWYPLRAGLPHNTASYMPELDKYRGVASDRVVDVWSHLRSPVAENGPAARGPFPILIFSHGWSSRAASYSAWITEVASHGFVVIGIDHPYLGTVATVLPKAADADDTYFPNQKYANLFYADDLAFVTGQVDRLNRDDPILRGVLRKDAVAGAGHSSGFGAALSTFAALSPRLRALISFDAGLSLQARERGLSAPLLLVRADSPTYTDIFLRRPMTHPKGTIYDSAAIRKLSALFLDLQIVGTGHNAVSDDFIFLDGAAKAKSLDDLQIISHYTVAYLKSVFERGEVTLPLRPADAGRVRLRRVVLGQSK